MFDAHVILLPIALAGLFYAHFALFESHGIAPPATSDPLQRRRFTEKEEKGHVPFIPHVLLYTMKWGLLYVGILFGIAALWPWNLPTYVGNTAAAAVVTEPDWYFLWVFKLVDFAGVTPVIAIGVTNVLLVYILFLPFLDRSKRTHPRDRPFFIYLATCMLGFLILMTVWGGETPGVQITGPGHRDDVRSDLRRERGRRRPVPLPVPSQLPATARGPQVRLRRQLSPERFVPRRWPGRGRGGEGR